MRGTKSVFLRGMKDGIPIALGYFAVAFSLGIIARNAGFSAFQGFISSALTSASAGQYVGYTLYLAEATIWQLVIMTIVTNLRYLLMGFALNQRLEPEAPLWHRFMVASTITDEIFGITISKPGYINPLYPFGAIMMAMPFWAAGTALGITMGNILPLRLVSALSVALYGMFLAIIIPPAKHDKVIGVSIIVSFLASYAMANLPVAKNLSAGNRTIILTIVISAAVAVIFPVSKKKKGGKVG